MILFKPKYPSFFIFSLIVLIELLSLTAYFFPSLQIYLLAVSFLAVFFLSLYSLETGILIALTELVIGSKGHLFSAIIFNFPVSLRLLIWSALMLVSVIIILRRGPLNIWKQAISRFRYWPFVLALLAFIILAFIRGLVRGNPNGDILADGNAWLYLSLLLPVIIAYAQPTATQKQNLKKVFFLAVSWLSLKTLILLFIFSHNLAIMPDIYLWVRRSGVGEITAMGGAWYRIFIQSQIYAPIAFFLWLWPALKNKANKLPYYLLSTLSVLLAVIIISMSRSFWLAFVMAAGLTAIFSFRNNWRLYGRALIYSAIAFVGALILIFIIVKFPYPNPQAGLSASALSARLDLNGGEAALSSRWSLLPNLWQGIMVSPVFGQGFGANISYFSQDPRVLSENPSGWYTTYAFEWAYLDTWLKLGLFGLLAYLIWIFAIIIDLIKKTHLQDNLLPTAIIASLLFLMITNIFTPYLNHPLGLAFLIFSSCFIKKNPL